MQTGQLEHELRQTLEGEVRFDPYSRAMYSTDASIYQIEPLGVVLPRSREDVIAAVELASKYGVPVLPRGGGTSLAGQTVGRAIILDMSKYMHRVLEVNTEEQWARVQPGIVLEQLNHEIRDTGLFFTPDPATSNRSNVGGAIGNNSCGSHSVVYGKTIDHIIELDTVLSSGEPARLGPLTASQLETRLHGGGLEGEIYRRVREIARENASEVERRYPKVMRRVGGYNLDQIMDDDDFNLAKMIVGSEGTLAAVTEAKVNLEPRPGATALMAVHFSGLIESMEATVATLEFRPSAVELVGRVIIQQINASLGYRRRSGFIEGDPHSILLVETAGDTEAEVGARIEEIERNLRRGGMGYAFIKMTDRAEQANVWEVRKAGIGLMMGVKSAAKPIPFIEDCAVDTDKLPEYIQRVDDLIRENGTEAAYYGHASVGCIHVRPFINLKEQEDVERMYRISRGACDLVMEMGGAMSGEHGDGLVRSMWNERVFGTTLYNAFREVKQAFDPKGIMNPGKIVDSPSMVENLRYGGGHRSLTLETKLDFSRDGGITQAVEMCSGLGACRNTLGGTMCPSYMATREEEHSTRGRANALRAVLSGMLPPEEFTSDRMRQVMDLCLECKACKSECPSQVDMAKLKYEFLDAYHTKHGYPLRSKLFANIGSLSKLGSAFVELGCRLSAHSVGDGPLHGRGPAEALAGVRRAHLPAAVPQSQRSLRQANSGSRGTLQRHVHELQLPEYRNGGHASAGAGRIRRGSGGSQVLRPPHDLQGHAGRRQGQRTVQRRPAVPLRGAGRLRGGLRAELPADPPGRVPGPPALAGSRPRRGEVHASGGVPPHAAQRGQAQPAIQRVAGPRSVPRSLPLPVARGH